MQEIGIEGQSFPCYRMIECKRFRMQCLPWKYLKAILYKLLVFCKCGSFKDLSPPYSSSLNNGCFI